MSCISLLYYNLCIAQSNSIPKHYISFNIPSAILSGELGFYYDTHLSKTFDLRASYGHRFWQFNVIKNGDVGGDYKYLPQRADIARFSLITHFHPSELETNSSLFLIFQPSYWKLQTPKYITTDGSNGLNSSTRYVISVQRKMFNSSIGFGHMLNINKHFYTDMFLLFGISFGTKYTHYYTRGYAGHEDIYIYPENTIESRESILPTIDIGTRIGYRW